MTAACDGAGLLRDIIDHPGDDAPRLIYADWLEEHGGQPERAEFIRVQCEISASQGKAMLPRAERRFAEMKRREFDLLAAYGNRWAARPQPRGASTPWAYRESEGPVIEVGELISTFRRGFVHHIRLPLDAFMGHAGSLFSQHPITAVALSDREARHGRHPEGFEFYREDPAPGADPLAAPGTGHALPPGLYDRFQELPEPEPRFVGHTYVSFGSPGAAAGGLSAVCVLHGRDAAKKARAA
jgi:uncharacterized protein (TIGR02996 family)